MVVTQADSQTQVPFADVLTAHLPILRIMALRYTRNGALADDLVHDTAVRALRFQSSFVANTNFRAWIGTVMANTFINLYRRAKREREILEGATRGDVIAQLRSQSAIDAATQPEQHIARNLLSDTVLQALAQVPEDFRAAVLLCDVQGLSYRDAAAALNCPMGTIMSRLHRGRRLLKTQLAPKLSSLDVHTARAA